MLARYKAKRQEPFVCKEHGRVRARWHKSGRKLKCGLPGMVRRCPVCNRLNFKAWLVKNPRGNVRNASRYYYANREKVLARLATPEKRARRNQLAKMRRLRKKMLCGESSAGCSDTGKGSTAMREYTLSLPSGLTSGLEA